MITRIIAIASIVLFAISCGNNNANSHNEHDGHNHHITETTQIDVETEKQSANEALVDASGATSLVARCTKK